MSIDKAVSDLIAALNANTAALNALTAAGGSAPAAAPAAAKPAASGKGAKAAAAKATHTQAEVNGALIKLKDEFGMQHAKEIITSFGYDKMADIKEADYDAVFTAAEAKHAELSGGGGGGL